MIIDGKSTQYTHRADGTVRVQFFRSDGSFAGFKIAKSQRGANRMTENWFAKADGTN